MCSGMQHGLPALVLAGLAIGLPATAADRWAHPRVVTVVMVDDRFEPNQVTFHRGQPTELRLENHGHDMHEFTAPAFFQAATLRDRHVLASGGVEVVVQPGKSARVLLIPGKPGTYRLTCADHDWDGMVGTITVE